MATPPFIPGEIQITENALAYLKRNTRSVANVLARHIRCDWDDMKQEDRELNEAALIDGARILSIYTYNDEIIWALTKADRSQTTLLLPEDKTHFLEEE
jgi:hypothetical protein